jgi:tetratricopeptide (TPR) repeat protein
MSIRRSIPSNGSIAARWAATLGAALAIAAATASWAPSAWGQETLKEILALPDHEQRAALEQYVAAHPDEAEGHFQLGNWYYDQFKGVEAIAEYRKALALDPEHFRALVNACIVLEGAGQPDSALALYEGYISAHPKDARVLAYYGETLWSTDRKSQAIDTYRKALALDPRCAEARFNMGVAFAEMGIFREAIREWDAVIKIGEPAEIVDRARENIKRAEKKV